MDETPPDLPAIYTELQEHLRARLQPASSTEEHLVEQIVSCHYRLAQLEHRLSKTWEQLDHIFEAL
jgi:hypothetical protein